MEIKNQKLQLVKQSLMYAIMYAKTEAETAEFTFLLLDVETAIATEANQALHLKTIESLPGCVFKYCGERPKCVGSCVHSPKKSDDNDDFPKIPGSV